MVYAHILVNNNTTLNAYAKAEPFKSVRAVLRRLEEIQGTTDDTVCAHVYYSMPCELDPIADALYTCDETGNAVEI